MLAFKFLISKAIAAKNDDDRNSAMTKEIQTARISYSRPQATPRATGTVRSHQKTIFANSLPFRPISPVFVFPSITEPAGTRFSPRSS